MWLCCGRVGCWGKWWKVENVGAFDRHLEAQHSKENRLRRDRIRSGTMLSHVMLVAIIRKYVHQSLKLISRSGMESVNLNEPLDGVTSSFYYNVQGHCIDPIPYTPSWCQNCLTMHLNYKIHREAMTVWCLHDRQVVAGEQVIQWVRILWLLVYSLGGFSACVSSFTCQKNPIRYHPSYYFCPGNYLQCVSRSDLATTHSTYSRIMKVPGQNTSYLQINITVIREMPKLQGSYALEGFDLCRHVVRLNSYGLALLISSISSDNTEEEKKKLHCPTFHKVTFDE